MSKYRHMGQTVKGSQHTENDALDPRPKHNSVNGYYDLSITEKKAKAEQGKYRQQHMVLKHIRTRGRCLCFSS